MDKSKVYKRKDKNGKEYDVFRHDKVFNLKVNTAYIDNDYLLSSLGCNDISETGLIELFKITSKKRDHPSFQARWDEKENLVDIDIKNVSKNISTSFKSEKNGYSGHHSTMVVESPREYHSKICLPNKVIFAGTITFNINHGHAPNIIEPKT